MLMDKVVGRIFKAPHAPDATPWFWLVNLPGAGKKSRQGWSASRTDAAVMLKKELGFSLKRNNDQIGGKTLAINRLLERSQPLNQTKSGS
jgi:hypothetical protein